MIKTRLLKLLTKETKYVWLQIIWQWISLIAQVVIAYLAACIISGAFSSKLTVGMLWSYVLAVTVCVGIRLFCDRMYTDAGFKASVNVKSRMRTLIYEKLLRLGSSYRESVPSSQIIQMMGEGVEQLEIYFGKYISQFIYALLAPFTLFLILVRVDVKIAVVLLVAVPLIPMVIMVVMKVARKLLDGYFQIYYGLGDTFLEKLHGMTTLKIYGADEQAAKEMDEESERFRKITMKVLSMQLNSTIVMDIVAYGGTAVGMVVTIGELVKGRIDLMGAVMFIMLSAEFFLPMRLLGSFFHIGMNGMKAADKMFDFLDLPEEEDKNEEIVCEKDGAINIELSEIGFSYGEREILSDVSMKAESGKMVSIVGVSGSGKSTIAGILRGQNKGYQGHITINGKELSEIKESSLLENITTISHNSYIFSGTVRDNLMLGLNGKTALLKDADKLMWKALEDVNLKDFLEEENGLDTVLKEGGNNFSGGQRQRLAFARALLKDSPVYILDEATSNIDVESEEIIMKLVKKLVKEKKKTVILISHRLFNVVTSDAIYMLENGRIAESGTHKELINHGGVYASLYNEQKSLENYAGKEAI
ncbi:MAG: ABC transporter ATP-binding protein/permease [Butyrivibrio sp.]|nr:ABC transporter ATP-binding protein/permease [Butyrivibrio sp.]